MFRFALHKMGRSRWLTLSLLAGYLMAVAIVCSMPIYSHAILGRMLTRDLEQLQIERSVYPGRVAVEAGLYNGKQEPSVKANAFFLYDDQVNNSLLPDLGLPVQSAATYTAVESMRFVHEGITKVEEIRSAPSGQLAACEGLFDHVELVSGSLPSAAVQDGVYEAVVSEKAAYELGLSLGSTYQIYDYEYNFSSGSGAVTLVGTVKITGVITAADPSDLFWVLPWSTFDTAVLLDPGLFSELYIHGDGEQIIDSAQWAFALDYRAMTPENCTRIADVVALYSGNDIFQPTLRTSFADILEEYGLRREELNATLWIIEIPILLMLLFYIMMVSRLILEHEKNEIAVLRSRGASKKQAVLIYFWQSLLLAAAAMLLGPSLGLLFCRIIGASNGFMEFVNRKALDVSITPETILYAAVTAVVLILTMLFAVLFSGETSIVSFKRKKSGKEPAPLWQKLCLDLVCLAVSGYALYNFQNRLTVIRETGATASEIPIDFMMYGSSTLFILGVSLLLLRVFPLLVRGIYLAGQRLWGPVLYLSLLNTSRGSRKNQMISLFLIFTLSMGVFNSVMVRTLNQNEEDRIRYSIGADIVLQEEWPYTGGSANPMEAASDEPVYYTEPQFSKYEQMETADSAARVLKVQNVELTSDSQRISGITLMGIVPDEFGRTCWMKNSLLPHHINEYLNLLADEPRALLLSSAAMEEYGLAPGDTAFLSIGENKDLVQFVIYAGIEYFPSFNPVGTGTRQPVLAVANLIYLQQETKLEPYEVWLHKAEGASSSDLYAELSEMGIPLVSLDDASAEITSYKNDAMTQGINGFFTLSFLVTMLIAFAGFFIYWILAIRGRFLQFGILRSMGLSRLSVVMVLLWEQLLVSLTAILAGLGTGTLAAMLFAPILECNVDAAEQILPFTVTASPGDYWRIILIVAVMMAAAAAVLGRIVFRLHANEALKLGED